MVESLDVEPSALFAPLLGFVVTGSLVVTMDPEIIAFPSKFPHGLTGSMDLRDVDEIILRKLLH